MDLEEKKPPYPHQIDIDGMISSGKQFDLDITLPEDNRDVIYGIVKNCYKDPVKDALVKLVEIKFNQDGKEFLPVAHTFTDEDGNFVLGPLCPDKKYGIQIWINDTKKIKICKKCHHEGTCLKGCNQKCDFILTKEPDKPKFLS